MGKSKSKKSAPAASKAPKCICTDPFRCSCGNRPERPSKGHKWYPEDQIWAGKGHKQKGASGQIASKATEAKVTSTGKTTIEQWQRLPSQLLAEFCKKQNRQSPKYKLLAKYKFRVIVKDAKHEDRDLFYVPANTVSNEEQAKEEASLLALLDLTPTLPHERRLPDPYKTTWLNAIAARKEQKEQQKRTATNKVKTDATTSNTSAKPSASSSNTSAPPSKGTQKAQASSNLISAVNYSSLAERRKVKQERNQQRATRMRQQEALRMANRPHPVLMGEHMRKCVEELLRGETVVSFLDDDDDDSEEDENAGVDDITKDYVTNRLLQEGFSRKQARSAYAAVGKSGDVDVLYEEALQWLLIHLNDSQLPESYDPRGNTLDVVVAPGAPTNSSPAFATELDIVLQRLSMRQQDANLLAKSATIQEKSVLDLFWQSACQAAGFSPTEPIPFDKAEAEEMMEDEKMVLDSVFGSACTISSSQGKATVVRIADTDITLEVHIQSDVYPWKQPSRILVDGASFSLHVEIAKFMNDLPPGEPMIFAIHTQVMTLLESKGEDGKDGLSIAPFLGGATTKTGNGPLDRKGKTPESNIPLEEGKPKVRSVQRRPKGRRRNFFSISPAQTPPAKAFPDVSKQMQRTRDSLPAASARKEFLDALRKAERGGRVLLVTGETGSGKSTQLPAYILEEMPKTAKIVVAQPRRLAATGVANRVAEERGERQPGTESVGYVVRGDSATNDRTRLLFCTTGILLRQLQNEGALDCITHIVIDEVHERHLDSDILLGLLRENLDAYPRLQVILMSATLDKEKFETYWATKPPHIHVPGRTFPVAEHFLEDVLRLTEYIPPKRSSSKNRGKDTAWNDSDPTNEDPSTTDYVSFGTGNLSIQDLVARIDQSQVDYDLLAKLVASLVQSRDSADDGSILVFLAGAPEINMAMKSINKYIRDMSLTILPLHGGLQPRDQNRVFSRAQRGFTKVILSTNVAETSITIPDVTIVIDTCREKQASYDPTNRMPMLLEKFASKASLRQRKGRAGRVREGTSYRLIDRRTFAKLDDHAEPEIKRVALDQTLLQLLFLGVETGKGDFLQKLIDPPKEEGLEAAIFSLVKLGAIEPHGGGYSLSPLGMHLAGIPAPPVVGKRSILGCRDASVSMAAALSVGRNPFFRIVDKRRRGHRDATDEKEAIEDMKNENIIAARDKYKKLVGNSDHALLAALLLHFKRMKNDEQKRFCDSLGLNSSCMRDMLQLFRQLSSALVSAGFDNDKNANRNGRSWRLIHACAIAAMAPAQLVKLRRPTAKYDATAEGAKERDGKAQELKFFIRTGTVDESGTEPKTHARSQEERVFIHPQSANFSQGNYSFPFLVYHSLVRTSKPFLRDITEASPYALLLFGGELEVISSKQLIVVDGWAELSAHPRVGALVGGLRRRIDALLSEKVHNPSAEVSSTVEMKLIAKLITADGLSK